MVMLTHGHVWKFVYQQTLGLEDCKTKTLAKFIPPPAPDTISYNAAITVCEKGELSDHIQYPISNT